MKTGGEVKEKHTRKEIEYFLLEKNIEIKYDYTWNDENLNFHQKKSKANTAKRVLQSVGIKTAPVNYLFGDNYVKVYNVTNEYKNGGSIKASTLLAPKKLYRCTKTGMSFIEGGLGEHWGTKNSAKERCETLTTLIKEDGLEVPHIISAKITLKKPLKCNDDIGWKDFKVTSKYLLKIKAVTKKEINNFSSLSELRLLLQKKGYDGIEYANLEEDKGNSSYIVFSKKSIEYTNDYDEKPSFFKKLTGWKHKIKLTKMKMTKIKKTNDGKDGGLVGGKKHSEGGVKTIIVDDGRPVEIESGEVIITAPAVKKHWKELDRINQDGGGVPIHAPEMKQGGNAVTSTPMVCNRNISKTGLPNTYKEGANIYGSKISKVMQEFKDGKLRSSSGDKVTSQKQALAIAFSEERKMRQGGNL